jgi:hypothetical protein
LGLARESPGEQRDNQRDALQWEKKREKRKREKWTQLDLP